MNLTKVLVIDDSAALQQIYQMTLSRYMFQVISALSGPEGLSALADNPDTNLLIVDINMPHMSGLEFIKKVKEEETYREIPIIAVSDGKKESDAREALTFAQGNLTKPFTSNEIHALIASLFPQTPVRLPAWKSTVTAPRPSSQSTFRESSRFVRRA